jgi:hypothetical protein
VVGSKTLRCLILKHIPIEMLLKIPFGILKDIQFDHNQAGNGTLNINVNQIAAIPIEKISFVLDYKRFKHIRLTLGYHSSIEMTKTIFEMIAYRVRTVSVDMNFVTIYKS